MFSVFVPSESVLKKAVIEDLAAVPENAVWIDLVNPSAAEDKAVERLAGIAIPTREDMQEIEISSRLYMENGARYMTATLMCHSDTDMPRTTAVTFILGDHRLVTVRYDQPKPFALVEAKLSRSCTPSITGEMVLMELLDAVIDRCADILERCGAEIDQVSHDIFEPESERHGQAKRYSQILISIGRKGDLTSKVRESLVSIGRVVTFLSAVVEGVKWSKDMREQLNDHAARRRLVDRPCLLSLQQDHLRARRHARRRQSRAEQHHQAVLGDGRRPDAADADRLGLRHELQGDAGTRMGARLSDGAGDDAGRRHRPVLDLQVEEVAVGVMLEQRSLPRPYAARRDTVDRVAE
ncbi:Mg2+ and Co2+ transporter CorA [Bradyrhizobium liaoningense]